MQYRSLLQRTTGFAVLLVIAIFMAGCYTMFQHPQLTQEERAVVQESETTGSSCTMCHNNDYDHNRMSSHNSWGFGSWGVRSYPYGYSNYGYSGYGGYYGWQRYYYDPWWWGYGYDPYPYYYPPGGGGYGGTGTGSGMSATPERPETRRGWNGSPNSAPPPPPPVYTGGSTSGGGGSSSGGSSGGSNSGGGKRDDGRRGSGR